jgi:uncharacterized protein
MDTPKKLIGFAALDPERRREIARMGGAAVPAAKRTFAKDRELASQAGRIGGLATPEKFKFAKKKGPR